MKKIIELNIKKLWNSFVDFGIEFIFENLFKFCYKIVKNFGFFVQYLKSF